MVCIVMELYRFYTEYFCDITKVYSFKYVMQLTKLIMIMFYMFGVLYIQHKMYDNELDLSILLDNEKCPTNKVRYNEIKETL